MNKEIDQLTIEIWKKAVKVFSNLEDLRMVLINIRIAVARLGDLPEARTLNTVADYIQNEIIKLEDTTQEIRDAAKEIGSLNKHG